MKIIEDIDNDRVIINNIIIDGFIDDEKCSICSNSLIYHDKYDAYFCAYCNFWTEDTCGNSDCEFCKDRPEKPL